MRTNIERMVHNISHNVTLHTVLNEAVVNSIQANASKIDLSITRKAGQQLCLVDACEPIQHITLSDNGDGFTPAS